jgi:hypothetical protein
MVFVGILTNCAILGFSSEQLMQWLPSLFTRSISDGDQLMALGSGRYVNHPHYGHLCKGGGGIYSHGYLVASMKPAN